MATTAAGAGQKLVQLKEEATGPQQQHQDPGLKPNQQQEHGPDQPDRGPEQQQQQEKEQCFVGGKMPHTTKEPQSQTTSTYCGQASASVFKMRKDRSVDGTGDVRGLANKPVATQMGGAQVFQ